MARGGSHKKNKWFGPTIPFSLLAWAIITSSASRGAADVARQAGGFVPYKLRPPTLDVSARPTGPGRRARAQAPGVGVGRASNVGRLVELIRRQGGGEIGPCAVLDLLHTAASWRAILERRSSSTEAAMRRSSSIVQAVETIPAELCCRSRPGRRWPAKVARYSIRSRPRRERGDAPACRGELEEASGTAARRRPPGRAAATAATHGECATTASGRSRTTPWSRRKRTREDAMDPASCCLCSVFFFFFFYIGLAQAVQEKLFEPAAEPNEPVVDPHCAMARTWTPGGCSSASADPRSSPSLDTAEEDLVRTKIGIHAKRPADGSSDIARLLTGTVGRCTCTRRATGSLRRIDACPWWSRRPRRWMDRAGGR